MTTIGSLFTGYAGLDMAVEAVTGARTIWCSDIDPGACKIIAHHWPDVPNLGDISTVDWSQVAPVDIITGGFPCQDVSMAGRRAGLSAGTRSGLWAMMATAISHLRPSLVVIENVRGLLSAAADSDVEPCPWCVGDVSGEPPLRALGAVLGDLADIGYDAAWHGLTAASVGAPHGRFRVFIVAWPTSDAARTERRGTESEHLAAPDESAAEPRERFSPAADADRLGHERGGDAWGRWDGSADDGDHTAHTDRPGLAVREGIPSDPCTERVSTERGHRPSTYPGGVQPERRGERRDVGGAQGGDEGTGRQRERVRDATVDSGSVAPDATGGSEPNESGVNGRQPAVVGTLTGTGRRNSSGNPASGVQQLGGSSGAVAWGQFEPAIRRWERLTDPRPHRLRPAAGAGNDCPRGSLSG